MPAVPYAAPSLVLDTDGVGKSGLSLGWSGATFAHGAQSFTAPVSGRVDRVDLYMTYRNISNPTTSNPILYVMAGDPNSGTDLVGPSTVPLMSSLAPLANGWVTVDLSSAQLDLIAGALYTLRLDTSSTYGWWRIADQHAGGMRWLDTNSSAAWDAAAAEDHVFRLWVEEAVPMPAAILLFATGLLARRRLG